MFSYRRSQLFTFVAVLALLCTVFVPTPAQAQDTEDPPLCGLTPATIWGDDGPNDLMGTPGDDVIVGLGGDDTITGGEGNDLICAGGGHDTVTGDGGNDRIFGGQGFDVMSGGDGNDTLHGNRGDDTLSGNDGDDRIFGYSQNDIIDGGEGDDRLHGHFGDDTIDGGPGDDRIFGYGNNDTMTGGPGDDLMSGNFGDDTLSGGAGHDVLFGADGDDIVSGNDGNDELHGNSLNDQLNGGPGRDQLDGGIGVDACNGGPGSDTSSRCETESGIENDPINVLEAQWEQQRAAIVNRIVTAGWGVNGNVLTGPGGWTVDLSSCPSTWSDTAGVRDGKIVLGHTTAQSGALGAYGLISRGMNEYFQYLNDNGGIGPDGLQIELVTRDDAYVATQTQQVVDDLLATQDPFAITTLGTPPTFAVQDRLNNECVPQPLSLTGHSAWGDPVNNPWTTGLQMSYQTEALLWAKWIEDNFTSPIRVSALVMDNDFGLTYESAFERWAEQSDAVQSVEFIRHDPAAATLTNEMTVAAFSDPDVFIMMTAGNACLLAIQEAERTGMTANGTALFAPSVCTTVSAYLAPAGSSADGWLAMGGGIKDTTDPVHANDPYISWVNSQIDAAGLDSSFTLSANGYGFYGWTHGQALQIAAELPGGLTRTNFMIALRALEMEHPALYDGIALSNNGAVDAYLIEGSDVRRFNATTQSWVHQGVLDINGLTPNCAWQAGGGCVG